MRARSAATRQHVLPVWALASERNGAPAVKIFVQDEEAQGLRLNRIVQEHPGGYYAAYRQCADEPFLIANDLDAALGIVRNEHLSGEDVGP
jgi:hypothetical protein